jgi:hypothetical protein
MFVAIVKGIVNGTVIRTKFVVNEPPELDVVTTILFEFKL